MSYSIAVTGASGFIGAVLVKRLIKMGHSVLQVDQSSALGFLELLEKNDFQGPVVHLGACTDTLCHDKDLLARLNINYSKKLFQLCALKRCRLIYASSAATYGDGSGGFSDKTELLNSLRPMNPYGDSKHEVDLWAIEQAKKCEAPPAWAGLKFFNVYGSTEGSKGKMASMVFQIMRQIESTSKVRLFKYGEQERDWVYVEDVCNVICHMLGYPCYGIYNVGSGSSRSFNDIAGIAFEKMGKATRIEYFDMPAGLTKAYQGYSQAELHKLRLTGFARQMTTLEEGIEAIVKEWLEVPDEQ